MTLTRMLAIKSVLGLYMLFGFVGFFFAWVMGESRYIVSPGMFSVSVVGFLYYWIERKIKNVQNQDKNKR